MKPRTCLTALALLVCAVLPTRGQTLELQPGDSVVVVGNTYAERMALSGYFDALAHAAFPDHNLVIRHVPNSADEVAQRPRETKVPRAEFYLQRHGADVIVMCFGMSESFNGIAGLEKFEADLIKQIDAYQKENFNGESAPRLVLVSPIAHEDLGAPLPTGDAVTERNAVLKAYTDTMRRVSADKGVTFVDLFTPSLQWHGMDLPAPLTNNGIAPTEYGCFAYAAETGRQLGWLVGDTAAGNADAAAALRTLAYDKHYHFRLRYRATNTEYVWGRRHAPYGVVNFPPELDQLDRMTTVREQAIWAMDKPTPNQLFHTPPTGPAVWESTPTSNDFAEDTDWSLPDILPKGRENSVGDLAIADPEEMLKSFTVPEGYAISCFASENDFPELANPLGMTFDYRGRLWVLVSPTYPHLLPGAMPDCKLLIIEDTNNDGRADKLTVFAEHMNIPTGFAIDTDAVYVGQAPDLWKLTDTDGDDVADRKEIVYSGFGMPDSHHTISAFAWDPNGGFLMLEGVFTKTNVETPYGTQRTRDAAVWRYDPRTQQLIAVAHTGHPNPWGHTYDGFGQSIMMDTSGQSHYNFSGLIAAYNFPHKPKKLGSILDRGRPNAGSDIIHSRHFPEDAQNTYVHGQCIGDHVVRWTRLIEGGDQTSGYTAQPMPMDLVKSSDTNFRPVCVEVGPDGSLFIADWSNPLIGHMQYNVRDPRRDNTHGRIWRVVHTERPLLEVVDLTTLSTEELLETLKVPETNTRQLARRLLQKQDPAEVSATVKDWLFELNPRDPDYDRLALEALWVMQATGTIDVEVVEEVMRAREPQARAGAVRVLRYALQYGHLETAQAKGFIAQAVNDRDMRVRLEAVHACAFLDTPDAVDLAKMVSNQEMDDAMRIGLEQTLKVLKAKGFISQSGIDTEYLRGPGELAELAGQEMTPPRALAVIATPEVSLALRRSALGFLADDASGQAKVLLNATRNNLFDPSRTSAAITPLMLELPASGVASVADDLNALLASEDPGMRSLAMSIKVRAGAPLLPLAELDQAALVAGIKQLPDGQAPPGTADQLMQLVEDSVIDPSTAITQAVRLTSDYTSLFQRLAGYVDPAQASGYDQWDEGHKLGMAALAAMHGVPDEQWPAGFDRYRVARASHEQFELGKEIYHEQETGCIKCHGAMGEGTPGFPPLAGSPWVLGNPARAAAVVKFGLNGELGHAINPADGKPFNAQMEPLSYIDTDEEVAAVLTYVRQSWGNFAPAVTPAQAAAAPRPPSEMALWEADALLKRYPFDRDRLMGAMPAPQIRIVSWQPPEIGLTLMLVGVLLLMGLILLATVFGGGPTSGAGRGSSTTPALA